MTVTIQTDPAFVICHGAGHRNEVGYFTGPLGDGRSSAKWNVPRQRPLRAAVATPVDRGLAEHVFDLSVSRVFATEAAATMYRMALPGIMPRGANDILIEETGEGDVTQHGAVLESVDIVQTGVELEIAFMFSTAGCTQEEPAP